MKLQFEPGKYYVIDGFFVQLISQTDSLTERGYTFRKIDLNNLGEIVGLPNAEKRVRVQMSITDYVNLKPEQGEIIQIDGVIIYDGQKSRIKKLTRVGEMVELEVEFV